MSYGQSRVSFDTPVPTRLLPSNYATNCPSFLRLPLQHPRGYHSAWPRRLFRFQVLDDVRQRAVVLSGSNQIKEQVVLARHLLGCQCLDGLNRSIRPTIWRSDCLMPPYARHSNRSGLLHSRSGRSVPMIVPNEPAPIIAILILVTLHSKYVTTFMPY